MHYLANFNNVSGQLKIRWKLATMRGQGKEQDHSCSFSLSLWLKTSNKMTQHF